ncbi:MAG: hypothetical protein AB7T37_08360 [Dehalococcoidia bacterium]
MRLPREHIVEIAAALACLVATAAATFWSVLGPLAPVTICIRNRGEVSPWGCPIDWPGYLRSAGSEPNQGFLALLTGIAIALVIAAVIDTRQQGRSGMWAVCAVSPLLVAGTIAATRHGFGNPGLLLLAASMSVVSAAASVAAWESQRNRLT